jgi:hypothetical protein
MRSMRHAPVAAILITLGLMPGANAQTPGAGAPGRDACKLLNFVLTNEQSCGIAPGAGEEMKENHARTLRTRGQICGEAADKVRLSAGCAEFPWKF